MDSAPRTANGRARSCVDKNRRRREWASSGRQGRFSHTRGGEGNLAREEGLPVLTLSDLHKERQKSTVEGRQKEGSGPAGAWSRTGLVGSLL
jgi:hypothetical protein